MGKAVWDGWGGWKTVGERVRGPGVGAGLYPSVTEESLVGLLGEPHQGAPQAAAPRVPEATEAHVCLRAGHPRAVVRGGTHVLCWGHGMTLGGGGGAGRLQR